ncbi:hypothetical protein BX661DRAFT_70627, partial [Kickxella alabastrina]|uniref:uncharacterized protein n=1 Tax=Kickxella alabastrina TaxID=61397 RepID=UPI00221FB436
KNPSQILPRIYAQKLKQLILSDTPHHFLWKYFQNKMNPGDVYFNNLKELEIRYYLRNGYSKTYVLPDSWRYKLNSGDKYKVHFPSLKKLNITDRPPDADISFADNYPKHIERFEIDGTFFAEKSFDNSNIKSVGNLIMWYYMADESME